MAKEPKVAGEQQIDIQREVEQIIQERSQHWKLLQDRLRRIFEEYAAMPPLDAAIYRIYSRGDKQKGEHGHLKSAHKIAQEILIQRNGGEKIRNNEAVVVKARPRFGIYDVTDILGITIVCPFPSDVTRVADRVRADAEAGMFRLESEKKLDRVEYAATHMVLGFDGEPFYALKCELQIKTAFQDAFGWKTHALAYKADERTDTWYIRQLKRINIVIRSADELSDDLRARILRDSALGRERREQARQGLKDNLRVNVEAAKDPNYKTEFARILEELEACRTTSDKASRLAGLRQKIDEMVERCGLDTNTFRVAALYVIDCGRSDFTYWFDQMGARLVAEMDLTKDDELNNFVHATVIQTMAYYCMGNLKTAIRLGEAALARARDSGNLVDRVHRLTANLAYFYAEHYANEPTPATAERASELAELAQSEHSKPLPQPLMDTVGFVLLQTGGTVADVERGLALCRAAHDELQQSESQKSVSNHFFELHREIAYRRLAQLTQAAAADN